MGGTTQDESGPGEPGAGFDIVFRRAWWVIALRGLLAASVGLVLLSRPAASLGVLLMMLGFYLVFDGVATLIVALQAGRAERRWWPYFWEGLLSGGVGVLALARPHAAALGVLAIIAVRAILAGAVEIASGRSLRRAGGGPAWMFWIGGVASIAFGVVLLATPATGVVALVLLAGTYGVVFGTSMLAEAFELIAMGRTRFASRMR